MYADGVEVHHGDELKPTQVRDQPIEVQWPGEKDEFYTLILAGIWQKSFFQYFNCKLKNQMCSIVDPDAPNRKTHEARSWQHWIVCNIKGNDLKTGTVLTECKLILKWCVNRKSINTINFPFKILELRHQKTVVFIVMFSCYIYNKREKLNSIENLYPKCLYRTCSIPKNK